MRNENFLNKDMKKVMLKIRILRRIGRERVNSYALLNEFGKSRHLSRLFADKDEMKNEIYNTIKSLENSNYIESAKRTENGRQKNYYTLTKKGSGLLKSAKAIFRRHIAELAALLSN